MDDERLKALGCNRLHRARFWRAYKQRQALETPPPETEAELGTETVAEIEPAPGTAADLVVSVAAEGEEGKRVADGVDCDNSGTIEDLRQTEIKPVRDTNAEVREGMMSDKTKPVRISAPTMAELQARIPSEVWEGLSVMFRANHGRDATVVEVQQWVAAMEEADAEGGDR